MSKTPTIGTCPLCGGENKRLAVSHYMPSALYAPRKRAWEYFSREGPKRGGHEAKAPLFCDDCEALLNRKGESYILNLIATKAPSFPLHEKLRLAVPRESFKDVQRFSGEDLGLDMEKFAYFAVSIVWRGSITQWIGPNGTPMPEFPLGNFGPPLRDYLLGKAPLLAPTTVIVIVNSDKVSRDGWFFPQCHVEVGCLNFRFSARGVFFRLMMGHVPEEFQDIGCTSPRRCIFYGDGEHRMLEAQGRQKSEGLIIV